MIFFMILYFFVLGLFTKIILKESRWRGKTDWQSILFALTWPIAIPVVGIYLVVSLLCHEIMED